MIRWRLSSSRHVQANRGTKVSKKSTVTEQELVKILQERGQKAFRVGSTAETPVRTYTRARRTKVAAAAPAKRAS